jgi:hypothetical protein
MNAQLVKIDVAAATLGWSAGKLFDLVDGGTLLERGFAWVFNLANDREGERRDLRFWLPEISMRASLDTSKHRRFSNYELEWVINKILPATRKNFHAGEVDELFQIRPRTRIDLHDEICGSLRTAIGRESGRHFYSRDALAAFLTRRWIHAKTFSAKHRPAVTIRGSASPKPDAPELGRTPTLNAACGSVNRHTAVKKFPARAAGTNKPDTNKPGDTTRAPLLAQP